MNKDFMESVAEGQSIPAPKVGDVVEVAPEYFGEVLSVSRMGGSGRKPEVWVRLRMEDGTERTVDVRAIRDPQRDA